MIDDSNMKFGLAERPALNSGLEARRLGVFRR